MPQDVELRENDVALIHPVGRLDMSSAHELRDAVAAALSGGARRLLVDMSGVSFVDSSGLGAIIGGLKAARLSGGDLRLVNPSEQARSVLALTTLDRVLRIYDTEDDALAER